MKLSSAYIAIVASSSSLLIQPANGQKRVASSGAKEGHLRALADEPFDMLSMSISNLEGGAPASNLSAKASKESPASNPSAKSGKASKGPTALACGLPGKWVPPADICKTIVIGGGNATVACNTEHELELRTNILEYPGTLTGTKEWTNGDGTEESVDVIGFYDDADCSFSLVSTTTDMTFTGTVDGSGKMMLKATRPGMNADNKAVTYAGVFTGGSLDDRGNPFVPPPGPGPTPPPLTPGGPNFPSPSPPPFVPGGPGIPGGGLV